ncbi:UGSC family (seleno)protein [Microbacterium elymi]|uniref:UGSC family (Seleno)protein n=1 Tax=Microbacterium elymi TaxID=2909587 RepID=A0ABY5NIB9_9MICO|nr:UGSC family (seleno)protein [Microbacterium elymi]UUT34876.1 UGSC family (seleno)protein [Microbacterium elymi]
MSHAILDPTGRAAGTAAPSAAPVLAPRPADLTGLHVGLLDNTKHNALLFLTELGSCLVRECGAADVSIVETKKSFSVPVDDEIVTRYKDACDVVVTGVGDCGSCSAAAVADGIAFERAGLPAAVVLTDAFGATGRTMAQVQGAPDYEWITTQHPMAVLDPDQVKERARRLLPEITRSLTGAAA